MLILYGLTSLTISFVAITRLVGRPLSLPSLINSHKPLPPKSKRHGTSSSTRRISTTSRSKSRGKTMIQSSRRKAERRSQPRPRGDLMVQRSDAIPDTPTVAAVVEMGVPACPTCGLQAPQALMMEHFQASPSHEGGIPQQAPVVTDCEVLGESIPASSEEESKNSMRNLLQMLVPPRAFGRRHQNRTVNPLSHVIKTIEESRSGVIRPLK